MKKYISSALFAAFTGAAVLTGCSLDVDNKANIEAGKQLEKAEAIEALRVSMYSTIKPIVNETAITEWGTDLYTTTKSTTVNDYQGYKFTPENSDITSFYSNCNDLIQHANELLQYCKGDAKYEAEAKFMRAFGYYQLTQQFGSVPYNDKFINDANDNYPRTPLKEIYDKTIADLESIVNCDKLPETDHKGNISRRAVKGLLAKVCLAAGWDLETKLDDAEHGTYTKTGDSYFQKAAEYAKQTIAGQQLTMSFEDKWSPKNEGNEEEIFSVQYDRDNYPGDKLKGGNSRQNTYGSEYGNVTFGGLKNCDANLAPSMKSLYLFDKGDDRWEGTFMTTIYNYTPNQWLTTGYYAYYNATDEAKANMQIAFKYFPYWTDRSEIDQYIAQNKMRFIKGDCPNLGHVALLKKGDMAFWWFKEDGSIDKIDVRDYDDFKRVNAGSVPPVKKFDDPNTDMVNEGSCDYRDIPVLHLSDMYLVAAEAYYMCGNEGLALDYVNAVRSRSHAKHLNSINDYTPNYEHPVSFGSLTMLDLILDERARELYAETTRWVDLRRTRQLVRYCLAYNDGVSSVETMSNSRGEIKWLRPIPAKEIETNTALTSADQNPGY